MVVGLALAEAGQLTRGLIAAGRPAAALRRSTFAPLVGDRFELAAGNRRATALLVGVSDLGSVAGIGAQAGPEDAFALLFHASGGPRLDQDVMTIRHSGLGELSLLVAPAGTGRHGQDYAAIINRTRPTGRSGATAPAAPTSARRVGRTVPAHTGPGL